MKTASLVQHELKIFDVTIYKCIIKTTVVIWYFRSDLKFHMSKRKGKSKTFSNYKILYKNGIRKYPRFSSTYMYAKELNLSKCYIPASIFNVVIIVILFVNVTFTRRSVMVSILYKTQLIVLGRCINKMLITVAKVLKVNYPKSDTSPYCFIILPYTKKKLACSLL